MEDTTRRTDWTIVISYYLIWLGSSLLAGKTAYLSSYTMAGLEYDHADCHILVL